MIFLQGITSSVFAAANYKYIVVEQNDNYYDNSQYVVNVPEKETFEAILQVSVNSDEIKKGDIVSAVVRDDWIYNGMVVAPAGSIVYGKIVKSKPSGGFWRNGKFSVQFNEIVTPDGILYVTTDDIKINKGKMRWMKVFVKFLSGAALGALSTPDSAATAAATGLVTGVMNASEKGSETILPAGYVLNLRLKKHVQIGIQ
ncbi:hypothetical protein II906_06580 [bacterium]|nr:hypothetical protein [bacterium]